MSDYLLHAVHRTVCVIRLTLFGHLDLLLQFPDLSLHLRVVEFSGAGERRRGEGGGIRAQIAADQVAQFIHCHNYSLQVSAVGGREGEGVHSMCLYCTRLEMHTDVHFKASNPSYIVVYMCVMSLLTVLI